MLVKSKSGVSWKTGGVCLLHLDRVPKIPPAEIGRPEDFSGPGDRPPQKFGGPRKKNAASLPGPLPFNSGIIYFLTKCTFLLNRDPQWWGITPSRPRGV